LRSTAYRYSQRQQNFCFHRKRACARAADSRDNAGLLVQCGESTVRQCCKTPALSLLHSIVRRAAARSYGSDILRTTKLDSHIPLLSFFRSAKDSVAEWPKAARPGRRCGASQCVQSSHRTASAPVCLALDPSLASLTPQHPLPSCLSRALHMLAPNHATRSDSRKRPPCFLLLVPYLPYTAHGREAAGRTIRAGFPRYKTPIGRAQTISC
jgi:hypothetical protein